MFHPAQNLQVCLQNLSRPSPDTGTSEALGHMLAHAFNPRSLVAYSSPSISTRVRSVNCSRYTLLHSVCSMLIPAPSSHRSCDLLFCRACRCTGPRGCSEICSAKLELLVVSCCSQNIWPCVSQHTLLRQKTMPFFHVQENGTQFEQDGHVAEFKAKAYIWVSDERC
jgi:hypothetical protein